MKRSCSLAAVVVLGVTAAWLLGGCGGSESGGPAGEAGLAPTQVDSAGKMRVLIGSTATPGRAEANIVRAAGGTVMRSFTIVPVINAMIPASAQEALERNPNVAYVEGDPEDQKRHDAEVEAIAMRVCVAYEEDCGAVVRDVCTPELSRQAGLGEWPGFDVHSKRPDGEERAIEVKGRAGIGDVELTENEWAQACNLRERYWLYVVFECASATRDC